MALLSIGLFDSKVDLKDIVLGRQYDVYCGAYKNFNKATVIGIKDKNMISFNFDNWPNVKNNVTIKAPSPKIQAFESQMNTPKYDYTPNEKVITYIYIYIYHQIKYYLLEIEITYNYLLNII